MDNPDLVICCDVLESLMGEDNMVDWGSMCIYYCILRVSRYMYIYIYYCILVRVCI